MHAEEAYRTASRRFPTADRPIFSLGKLAFDNRRDYSAAAHWFEEYLRRFPQGALAQEATGRLLEARLKMGDIGAAHDIAKSYLRSFPNGPHAELARRTIGP